MIVQHQWLKQHAGQRKLANGDVDKATQSHDYTEIMAETICRCVAVRPTGLLVATATHRQTALATM